MSGHDQSAHIALLIKDLYEIRRERILSRNELERIARRVSEIQSLLELAIHASGESVRLVGALDDLAEGGGLERVKDLMVRLQSACVREGELSQALREAGFD